MQTTSNIIQKYVNGWKTNDRDKILSVLTEDCIIIESHGPTYTGKKAISRWIDDWIHKGNVVNQFDILSYYWSKDVVFVEWIFECTVNDKIHRIEGCSIFKFRDGAISFIREYRTTKLLYPLFGD